VERVGSILEYVSALFRSHASKISGKERKRLTGAYLSSWIPSQ
jgi:hypothetical protein